MKLVTWLVMLYNRKWQGRFDKLVLEVESEKAPEPVPEVKEEPNPIGTGLDTILDIMDQQPTHLSRRFRVRPRRKKYNTKPKPSTKEEALQEAMDEEFKHLAEGG